MESRIKAFLDMRNSEAIEAISSIAYHHNLIISVCSLSFVVSFMPDGSFLVGGNTMEERELMPWENLWHYIKSNERLEILAGHPFY